MQPSLSFPLSHSLPFLIVLNDFRHPLSMKSDPFLDIAMRCKTRPRDIEELVLGHAHLTEIPTDSWANFPNVQYLYVPFNDLIHLHHLDRNSRLKVIDARDNRISAIDLTLQIERLLLSNNCLQDLDLFLPQIAHMRDLQVLDLRGNPLCQEHGYRRSLIAKMLSLTILDSLNVVPRERAVWHLPGGSCAFSCSIGLKLARFLVPIEQCSRRHF
jgi:hypothetical protein